MNNIYIKYLFNLLTHGICFKLPLFEAAVATRRKKHKCKYLSAPLKMLHCLDEMKNIKEI